MPSEVSAREVYLLLPGQLYSNPSQLINEVSLDGYRYTQLDRRDGMPVFVFHSEHLRKGQQPNKTDHTDYTDYTDYTDHTDHARNPGSFPRDDHAGLGNA